MNRLLIPLLAALALPTAVKADIRSYCFNEWGENYEMVEYFMNQQSAALQRIGGSIDYKTNFDQRKNLNDLPCSNYIIVDKKKDLLKLIEYNLN